jgi:hypothetical protein
MDAKNVRISWDDVQILAAAAETLADRAER